MEPGFIPDATYGGTLPMRWVEGVPEKSFLGGLKLRGKKQHPVTADRCRSCGYLELYARG
jgi:hypothetical protein